LAMTPFEWWCVLIGLVVVIGAVMHMLGWIE
jgi:hypothetical protein